MLVADILLTFGLPLAAYLKKDQVVGPGLISLSVKDAGKELNNLNYEDLRSVFRIQLRNRLVNMKVENADQIITQMLRLLEQKQSLFTLAAR